jgi:hypothetical protein
MVSYNNWLNQFNYVGAGCLEGNRGTMEEAMLHFFYQGVSPWIQSRGYVWSFQESMIANQFLRLCYLIDTTDKMDYVYDLNVPKPMHRDLYEDREMFNQLVDTQDLIKFLNKWSFRTEVVGTRFDHLIRDFCYTWVDVKSGKAGRYTQDILDSYEEQQEEEMLSGPDVQSKKKWELY